MPRLVDRRRNPLFFLTSLLPYLLASFFFASCSHTSRTDPSSLTFLIESSPTNLDPRFATDSQSQHIDGLLFSDRRSLGTLDLSPTADYNFLAALQPGAK